MRARDDACARLLLLIAKVSITPAQLEDVRQLAGQIANWSEFALIAADKFIAPLAHRHLQEAASDIMPPSALQALATRARRSVFETLRVVAAHIDFHKTCIASTGARHAYLKGVALAQVYYRDVGERFCRDIDVLVAASDIPRVISIARAAGYRVLVTELASPIYADELKDIEFLCRHSDVITLISKDGVAIEIHRKLDKLSVGFDLEQALRSAVSVTIADITVRVLAPSYHFAYICYHHSRHFWSRLHWLADLDAMVRAPSFDRVEILALADTIGIRPTLEAALEFNRLTARPGLWGGVVPEDAAGGQFLKACLLNLEGGLDFEESLRGSMMYQDFISPWQVESEKRLHFWARSWARRLRPSVTQHFARRYPQPLHWLYTLENAMQLAKNGIALAWSPSARPGSPQPPHTTS
ncbi:MAG: nucleotidyltransferase family protein [Hyphomonadaceae bacterium]|nr:nucleotidyltransferase family protein [Hyphomonadaceae bacterium]MBY0565143.1 nucleotidyltransferase family protein [Hyphomonadaceae bacterium]